MLQIMVHKKDQESKKLQFNKNEITIGRTQGNDIVLPDGNVSKQHAKLLKKDNKLIIFDLKSTNRTYVNGTPIQSSTPQMIKTSDRVMIGNFLLEFTGQQQPQAAPVRRPGPGPAPAPPGPAPNGAAQQGLMQPSGPPAGPLPSPGPPAGPLPSPVQSALAQPVPPGPHQSPPPPPSIRTPYPGQARPSPGPPPLPTSRWAKVSPQDGPGYSYLAINQGWLLLSPGGQLVFVADTQHKNPPIPPR